jgi:hypothetical protein
MASVKEKPRPQTLRSGDGIITAKIYPPTRCGYVRVVIEFENGTRSSTEKGLWFRSVYGNNTTAAEKYVRARFESRGGVARPLPGLSRIQTAALAFADARRRLSKVMHEVLPINSVIYCSRVGEYGIVIGADAKLGMFSCATDQGYFKALPDQIRLVREPAEWPCWVIPKLRRRFREGTGVPAAYTRPIY